VNPTPLGPGAAVAVGWRAAAVARSAAAQLQPDGSAEAVEPGAAALKAAQKVGSVAVGHSAAAQLQPDDSVEQAVLDPVRMEAQKAGSVAAALQADGSVEAAVPGALAPMAAQEVGSVAVGHSAAAALHLDGSVARAVPGAAALMTAQEVWALPVPAGLAQEFRAPGRLESPLVGYPDVAP